MSGAPRSGFIAREAAQMNLGLAPNPPNPPNPPPRLGALGGLGGGAKLKLASAAPSPLLPGFEPHAIARAEADNPAARPADAAGGADATPDEGRALASNPLPPDLPDPADADVESLARALMAESARNPAVTRIDEAKALIYYRGEALRRLDLIRQRAIDATSGEDIERQAIEAEEHQPMASPEARKQAAAAMLMAASPLVGVPGAVACRSCGRGIWCSPSWKGPPPPDLCWNCSREVNR